MKTPESHSVQFHSIWSEIVRIYKNHGKGPMPVAITASDIHRWSDAMNMPKIDLYDYIAVYLARGFHAGKLDYFLCNAITRDLFVLATDSFARAPKTDGGWADLFFRIFSAFDEGEYYHNGNRNENPVDVYTRPEIAKILQSYPNRAVESKQ